MRWLVTLLVIMLIGLQYRLWVGEGSFAEVMSLQREIDRQNSELETMRARNRALEAEVASLKNDLEAVEERARSELGMVRPDETFFQVPEPEAKPVTRDARR
ncbi:MAG: cell division protein FtsB [Pseudomonadota bacterium]